MRGVLCHSRFAGRPQARAACYRSAAMSRGPVRHHVSRMAGRLAALLLLSWPAQYAAAIQWDPSWNVHSNGQRLSVETFSSRLPPDAVARKLAGLNGTYQRYLVGDGRILLSGLGLGRHWLAEIQGREEGSQGYVSALYFDAARANMPSLAAGSLEATAVRLRDAGAGEPMRVFEFDSSAVVGVVALPGDVGAPGGVSVAPGSAGGGSGNRAKGTVAAAGLSLMPAQAQPGMALVVSMPEP